MEKFKDLMLDLETLGTCNNSAIVQIGACKFDRNTGEIRKEFCMNVDIEDTCKYGDITPSTVLWWLQQSKEAQDSVYGINQQRYSLKEVLACFISAMANGTENVWCHVDFDWVILQNAYKAVDLKFPFSYRMRKDLRTIVDIANVNLKKDYVREGIYHNALDDCKFQVKYTCDCFKKIGVNNVTT